MPRSCCRPTLEPAYATTRPNTVCSRRRPVRSSAAAAETWPLGSLKYQSGWSTFAATCSGVESVCDLSMGSQEGRGESQETQDVIRRGNQRLHRSIRHDVRRSGSLSRREAVHHGPPMSVSCFSHMLTAARIMSGSSMRGRPHELKPMPIKNLESNVVDELRPEYDLASLKGGVRGKYYARATAGTTMVLLEPDVAEAFPDGASVNKALRSYIRDSGKLPNKALQPTSRKTRRRKSKHARPARG